MSTGQGMSHGRVTNRPAESLFDTYPFTCPARGGPDSSYTTHGRVFWVISIWNSQKTSVENNSAKILGIRLPYQPNFVQKYLMSVGILPRNLLHVTL